VVNPNLILTTNARYDIEAVWLISVWQLSWTREDLSLDEIGRVFFLAEKS
jgi:hypothetical protein